MGIAGLVIITRLMGLIIAVIGTQMEMAGTDTSNLFAAVQ